MSLVIHFQVDAKQDSVISKLGQRAVYVHLVFAFPLHIAPPPADGRYLP